MAPLSLQPSSPFPTSADDDYRIGQLSDAGVWQLSSPLPQDVWVRNTVPLIEKLARSTSMSGTAGFGKRCTQLAAVAKAAGELAADPSWIGFSDIGLHPATATSGLLPLIEQMSPSGIEAGVARASGEPNAPPVTSPILVIPPSNVATVGIEMATLLLAAGASVVLRLPSRGAALLAEWARLVALHAPDLATRLLIVRWPSTADARIIGPVFEPCVGTMAFGSDSTLSHLKHLRPSTFLGHGSRWSLCIADASDIRSDSVAALARDIVMHDQRGCMSPRVLIVVESDETSALRVAQLVSEALRELAIVWPPQTTLEERAALARYRTEAVSWWLAANCAGPCPVLSNSSDDFVVLLRHVTPHSDASAWPFSAQDLPAGRLLEIWPMSSWDDVCELAAFDGMKQIPLQCIGYIGKSDAAKAASALGQTLHATRIAEAGTMQAPALGHTLDGEPLFRRLLASTARNS